MSHFAGYVLTRDLPPERADTMDHAATGAIRGHFARSPMLAVDLMREGPFWLATQTLPAWNDRIAQRDGQDNITVIAGDPIACEASHAAAATAAASSALRAALTSGVPDALALARGSFAAVGWHAKASRLTLATDAVGSRCLYYRQDGDRLLFATSMGLLHVLSDGAWQADEQGLAETAFIGQPLADRTCVASVRVLRPGSALVAEPSAGSRIVLYTNLSTTPRCQTTQADAIERLHAAFRTAILRRLDGEVQQAFLSGGLDSRAVVAGLVDIGKPVRTFCAAYPRSIDDVVGELVARRMGTKHLTWHRRPADRVRTALDAFAIYARDHFETNEGGSAPARKMWSGDGGSVTLGHVYLKEASVATAAASIDAVSVRRLFPSLAGSPTRQLGHRHMAHWRDLATQGVIDELRGLSDVEPSRRLFHFYMRNDQARHLYHHFESIDQSRIELLTPFFDCDFVALVASLPIEWFLYHRLYNRWIGGFGCGANEIYWQPYRGHEPGPHANPSPSADQWDQSWYQGRDVRRAYADVGREVLQRSTAPVVAPFVNRPLLRAVLALNTLGVSRYNYEIAFARNIAANLLPPGG